MKKTIIHSSQVPLPGNSTSQAVGYGGLFFLSGQVALDPYHHRLIDDGSAKAEAQRVLENVRTLLLASGLDLAHVLKVTLYVKNLSDVSRVDEVYAEFFSQHPPARTVVEVSRLPHDALLAMDIVAAAPAAPARQENATASSPESVTPAPAEDDDSLFEPSSPDEDDTPSS